MNYTDEIYSLENRQMVRVLRRGAVFRFPNIKSEYLFFLREGLMKIAVANSDGKEVIKSLVKGGDFFGEAALLNEAEHPEEYAVALEDSVVSFLEAAKVRQRMQSHPALRAELFQRLGYRIRRAEERLLSLLFKDAATRIGDFLSLLASDLGHRTEQGYELKNFLTHDDIARLTDTSRQTVSSVLNELREQKLIEYNNEVVRIPQGSPLFPGN